MLDVARKELHAISENKYTGNDYKNFRDLFMRCEHLRLAITNAMRESNI